VAPRKIVKATTTQSLIHQWDSRRPLSGSYRPPALHVQIANIEITTNYAYDNLSRLLSVLHQVGASTIDGASYGLDNAGNRTSKTDLLANVTSNYTYDQIYELTQVTQSANTTESYSYDPVGNRLSSLGVASYAYNNSNELTSTSTASYTYDNNGNTTSKTDSTGTMNYTWDYENRLKSATLPGSGGTVTFKYDPLGRRIYKSSSAGTSTYVYDGYNVAEETNAAGIAVARYTSTRNVDEPLAMLRSGATSYYQTDALGTITSLSNGAGALAQTYTFDSFGNQTASSGSLTNSFRYTAREFDTETNLMYFRARYYEQSIGRFLSEDPMAYASRSSMYGYVGGSPITYSDPSGNTRIYGNWCGPDWTGGSVGEYNPAHDRTYLPPIDNVDYVCMQHDKCYYSCRVGNPCNRGDRQNCMRVCDQALIRDEPNTTWGNIIRNGIKNFNKNPDPGTNEHCGCKTNGT
jgi:RHS repeat-associated protein